jgi:hypothetical protein
VGSLCFRFLVDVFAGVFGAILVGGHERVVKVPD